MASFDFITSASKAYEFVWYYKGYLARVAVPVLFVEIFCVLSIASLGGIEELGMLRHNLIMMPAIFVEALFFAMFVRFVVYHEPIHIWGTLVDAPEINESDRIIKHIKGADLSRKDALQVSIACYILVFIFFTVLAWGVMLPASKVLPMSPEMQEQAIENLLPVPVRMFIALCVFTVIVWTTRLCVVNVPAAMGFRVSDYLKKMGGINNSAKMIILIFLCSFPVFAILLPFYSAIIGLLSFSPAFALIFEKILLYATVLLTYALSIAGLTFAFQELMTKEDKGK
ncbi:MAG: hypothetical protein OEY94_00795 [Alphaproteobacteria bacterium]|nr:hypothetical protein [Alphaproteobacteria bacterium]